MTTPTHCASCGHGLGVGRFCTNCGQPVPGRHPEAAPTTSAPVVPPPTGELPPAARYPLYAEAPPTTGPPAPTTRLAATPAASYAPPPPADHRSDHRRSRSWLPWVAVLAALALVAGIGAFLLLAGGDGDEDDKGTDPAGASTATGSTEGSSGAPSPRPSHSDSPRPDSTGTDGPVEAPAPSELGDLAPAAKAEVPATAPASRDRQNQPVTFAARNMLDADPRTSWRMPGDGTGAAITFDLGRPVVLTEVGLINGYAKVDGADNWYASNRRIGAVQWEFDDGTRITQQLSDRPTMQLIPVGPVATTKVVLHLLEVTAPGAGPNGRDFTAISDVRLRGARR